MKSTQTINSRTVLPYFLCLFLILLACESTSAQSPYELSLKKELPLFGSGLILSGSAYLIHQQLDPFTPMAVAELEAAGHDSFEKWATTQNDESADHLSDVFLYSSQIIPGILTLADKKMRKDFLKIGTMYSEVFILNIGMTAFTKNVVRRTRPYVYNPSFTLEEKTSKSARTSFFSGHTSETTAMCFLTARLFSDYHPNSKWRPYVWTAAAVAPAITGYLRVRAGRHFPTDVITGYAIGAAIGYFVPQLHRPKKKDAPPIKLLKD